VAADDVVVDAGVVVVVVVEAPVVLVVVDVHEPVVNELPASCPWKVSPDAAALLCPAVH
jgi:hypothetical protein